MTEKVVALLASGEFLAQRVQLEKKALEKSGYIVNVIYRGEIVFNFRFVIELTAIVAFAPTKTIIRYK